MRNDTVKRFGLLALATDLTIEGDAAQLMPPGTRLHVARLAFENPTTPETLRRTGPRLAAAADLVVPGVPLEAMIFGCTSAAAALGAEVEVALGSRAPVVTPLSAARRALAALGAGRIALMTPYLTETADLVAGWFAAEGVEVVSSLSLGHEDDREMARIDPAEVVAAACRADHPRAEAVFLSCTALPALGVIGEIEALLDKPVISSNQAAFWAALDLAGIPAAGPGTLFRIREGWRTW
ncbi:aspartate/glutamate racemase family protein [Poseidonocella sp. HB161398]|uniref:maleate cis-trans isomerase family protein n=1 Tax=Poseidonocella sp. HB161398 TaxID=2320855 RepID=UPI00110867BC|nr:aspartate/glutamate racemase family protein [Poseidonocella sp. HB161398]